MAIKKNEEAFSFFRFGNTEEIHIFKGSFTPDGCNANLSSICQKIKNRTEKDTRRLKTCLNENDARLYAAERGRPVCGICVSDLYETYD